MNDDFFRKITPRRHFLAMCGGACTFAACSGANGDPRPFGDVSAGNGSDVGVGYLAVVGSEPVILGRDEGGLYAMTNTCTHEGCDTETAGSGNSASVRCPCHGSAFDRNGTVTRGPARNALVHFAVSVDANGEITIHGGTPVDASVRTAFPV
jgi:nitrite reductase/ring-hydroxylating ferredoxin subunit